MSDTDEKPLSQEQTVAEEETKEPPKKRQKTDKGEKPAEEPAPVASTIRQNKVIEDKKPFSDGEAEQVIAEWMEKQNRPFSVQNLLDNFQHQLKRAQCIRILDTLTESQILTCKEYGKAKVYLINQDCFPETNPEQLKTLDEQIQVRKEEHDGLLKGLGELKENLKSASSGQTNEALAKELAECQAEVERLSLELKPFKESGAEMMTEAELASAEGLLKKHQLEWKRRKRGGMDVVNTISESMEMRPKDFVKKIGVETDEEMKVVCPL